MQVAAPRHAPGRDSREAVVQIPALPMTSKCSMTCNAPDTAGGPEVFGGRRQRVKPSSPSPARTPVASRTVARPNLNIVYFNVDDTLQFLRNLPPSELSTSLKDDGITPISRFTLAPPKEVLITLDR